MDGEQLQPAAGSRPRIVILGAGYGGLAAAVRVAKANPFAETLLVDQRADWSERIRLHQLSVGGEARRIALAEAMAPLGVRFVQARIESLDPADRTVELESSDGASTRLEFDYGVLSLGSHIRPPVGRAVAGANGDLMALDSPADAATIRSRLSNQPDARVLVVGGGLTGVELACEIAEAFPAARVTLATGSAWRSGREPGAFASRATEHLDQALRRLGVTQVADRVQDSGGRLAWSGDGAPVAFDICIWTAGFAPNGLARESGLAVTALGQVEVDAALRSRSHPHVLAVGDIAAASTPDSGVCRMSCAAALPMGIAAARSITAMLSGREPRPFEFNYAFRCVSLGRADGLIQFVDARDRPRSVVWTGRKAAAWKEYICRATVAAIGLAPMPKPPHAPPIQIMPQLMHTQRQYA